MRTSSPRTKFAATDLFDALTVREVAELEHRRIATRIKQARMESGLKQHEIAGLLEVTLRTYQNYESEKKPRIPWDRMNDLERITGKKVEWLLHGDSPDLMAVLSGGDGPGQTSDDLAAIRETLALQAEAIDTIARAISPLLRVDRAEQLRELREQLDLPSPEAPDEDDQSSDEQSG
jgi:transcriptional regulator with XRE-family HTH domain